MIIKQLQPKKPIAIVITLNSKDKIHTLHFEINGNIQFEKNIQPNCEKIKQEIGNKYNLDQNRIDLMHGNNVIERIEEIYKLKSPIELYVKKMPLKLKIHYDLQSTTFEFDINETGDTELQPIIQNICNAFNLDNNVKENIVLYHDEDEIMFAEEIIDIYNENKTEPIILEARSEGLDLNMDENEDNDKQEIEIINKDDISENHITVTIGEEKKKILKNHLKQIPVFEHVEDIDDKITLEDFPCKMKEFESFVEYLNNKEQFKKDYETFNDNKKEMINKIAQKLNVKLEFLENK